MAESEEELKSHLMKVKEESEKTGLTLNIQKTKIMASSPITTWQTDGETMETVSDFSDWTTTLCLSLWVKVLGIMDAIFTFLVLKLTVYDQEIEKSCLNKRSNALLGFQS